MNAYPAPAIMQNSINQDGYSKTMFIVPQQFQISYFKLFYDAANFNTEEIEEKGVSQSFYNQIITHKFVNS